MILWLFDLSLALCLWLAPTATAEGRGKIAGFGSSVCNGAGDEPGRGGYFGRFRDLMTPRGWTVINVSRNGDNSVSIQDRWEKNGSTPTRAVRDDQYLLPQQPDYVFVGLSLANEGIRREDWRGRDSVVAQFRSGLMGIVDACRRRGISVAVGSCYPHNAYTPEQYRAIITMNLTINTWDVPSTNLLGAIDDGEGHWMRGFFHDEGHPNAGGHREMSFAIVPSLFDALNMRKPVPEVPASNACARVDPGQECGFEYEADDTIHAFAISFAVRTGPDAVLLRLTGITATLDSFQAPDGQAMVHVIGPGPTEVRSALTVRGGAIRYLPASGGDAVTPSPFSPGKWHHVTLSHRCAKGETQLSVDGECVATSRDRWLLQRVQFFGDGTVDCDDIMVHRSALTREEVQALFAGRVLQSSLEIYAPLDEQTFPRGGTAENRAQSLSQLKIRGMVRPMHREP